MWENPKSRSQKWLFYLYMWHRQPYLTWCDTLLAEKRRRRPQPSSSCDNVWEISTSGAECDKLLSSCFTTSMSLPVGATAAAVEVSSSCTCCRLTHSPPTSKLAFCFSSCVVFHNPRDFNMYLYHTVHSHTLSPRCQIYIRSICYMQCDVQNTKFHINIEAVMQPPYVGGI